MKITTITKRAWEIRREAAKKWNCSVMEISWKGCLEMANKKNKIEAANDVAELLDGKVWAPQKEKGVVRIYLSKGYITVDEKNELNIDRVGGHIYMDIKEVLENNNYKCYRR